MGLKTWAEGNYSHAEGAYTHAKSTGGHAEGFNTKAYGNYSHAEGYHTVANYEGSHTGGQYTRSGRNYQTVVGEYNEVVTDALFVVGNGTSTSDRKNAFEVKTDGGVTLEGKVTMKYDSASKALKFVFV